MDHQNTSVFALRPSRKVKDLKIRHEEKPSRRKSFLNTLFRRSKKKKTADGRARELYTPNEKCQPARQNIKHNSIAPDDFSSHTKGMDTAQSPNLPPYTDDTLPAPDFVDLAAPSDQTPPPPPEVLAPPLETLETVVATPADEPELPDELEKETSSIISSSSTCRNDDEELDRDEDKYLSGVCGVRYRPTKERRHIRPLATEPGQEGFIGLDPRFLAKKNEAELNVYDQDIPQADDANHDANGLDNNLSESNEITDQASPLQKFCRVEDDDDKMERSGLLAGYGVKYNGGDAYNEGHTTAVATRTPATFEAPSILPFIVGGRQPVQSQSLPLLFSVVVNVAFVYELSVQVVAHVVEEKVDNKMAGWLRGKLSLLDMERRREIGWR